MTDTPRPPDPADRRIAPRFRPAYGTVCRFDPVGGKGLTAVGLVWDISQSGVSMLIAAPPRAGAILTGEIGLESGDPHVSVIFQVVHVRPVPSGDFILGAKFHRALSTDELKPFLTPPPRRGGGAGEPVDRN
jgi:hypothetical protein